MDGEQGEDERGMSQIVLPSPFSPAVASAVAFAYNVLKYAHTA